MIPSMSYVSYKYIFRYTDTSVFEKYLLLLSPIHPGEKKERKHKFYKNLSPAFKKVQGTIYFFQRVGGESQTPA